MSDQSCDNKLASPTESDMLGSQSEKDKPSSPSASEEKEREEKEREEKAVLDDPNMKKSREEVIKAKADLSGRVYRVYCDGIFDMFHIGHMNMLRQGKLALGDVHKVYLLVGVCSDELTHKYKGKTVMDHKTRCDSVAHCKWVDEVVAEAPWVLTDEFLEKYKIDFVAHDAVPYTDTSGQSGEASDVYALVKSKGMFLETQRTDGISTSDLIVTIVKDYDSYVMRNLSRGYSKQQLNVGSTWEIRHKAKEKRAKFQNSIKETRHEYEELSDAIKEFVRQFGGRRERLRPLRSTLPEASKGVWAHSRSLAKSCWRMLSYLFSWINPFSYLAPKHVVGACAVLIALLLWNYGLYWLGKREGVKSSGWLTLSG